jgi:hypothetical protein
MTRLPLYLPGEIPMLGMRSSVDPAALPRGFWRTIENLRISRASVTARLGCDELTSGVIVASASYRGHWVGRLDGTEYVYVALRVSGATRIYSLNTSTWAATEISSAPTRFSTDGDVCFAPYRELGIADGTNEGKDCLYISNGTADVPRCTKSGSSILDLLYNFDVSSLVTGSYRPIPAGYVIIRDTANTTLSVSDVDVSVADDGSTPNAEASVTVGASTDIGDYANIAWGTGSCVNIAGNTETTGDSLDLSKSKQLGIVFYDSIADPIHNYANIEVTNGSQVQIYDAQGVNRVDPAIVPLGGGYYLAAFNLEAAVATTLTAVTGVRVEFARTFAANRTFRVAGVLALGRVPQGTSYELSFAKMYSRVESAGMVLAAQPTAALSEYGCSQNISYKFPDNSSLYYQYRVDWGGTTPDANVDATFLYRREPGDFQAFFVADIGISNNPFNDNVRSQDRALFRPAPSAGGRGPVSGRCACYSNDRLFVGGINGGSSQVWISDQTFPLRFRAFATDEDEDGALDIDSGLSKSFPGEDVYQLLEMPGSLLGIAPVICFTSHAVRRFEGADTDSLSRPTFLNEHGTIYPRSISCVRGSVHYLDVDLIVRRFAGGIETDPISLFKIDDQLEAGDMSKAASIVYKDRYYLAHRASAATINQKVMVYETHIQEWVKDSYSEANQNWAGYAKLGTGSSRKLIAFTEEGRVYQIEKAAQATDDGTAITITLRTPELHKDMWSRVLWGRVGVMADELAATTWTTTRSDPQNASNEGILTGTIDMATNVPERVWRYDDNSGNPAGIASPSLDLTISGTYQNAKYLKSLFIEFDQREDGADVE